MDPAQAAVGVAEQLQPDDSYIERLFPKCQPKLHQNSHHQPLSQPQQAQLHQQPPRAQTRTKQAASKRQPRTQKPAKSSLGKQSVGGPAAASKQAGPDVTVLASSTTVGRRRSNKQQQQQQQQQQQPPPPPPPPPPQPPQQPAQSQQLPPQPKQPTRAKNKNKEHRSAGQLQTVATAAAAPKLAATPARAGQAGSAAPAAVPNGALATKSSSASGTSARHRAHRRQATTGAGASSGSSDEREAGLGKLARSASGSLGASGRKYQASQSLQQQLLHHKSASSLALAPSVALGGSAAPLEAATSQPRQARPAPQQVAQRQAGQRRASSGDASRLAEPARAPEPQPDNIQTNSGCIPSDLFQSSPALAVSGNGRPRRAPSGPHSTPHSHKAGPAAAAAAHSAERAPTITQPPRTADARKATREPEPPAPAAHVADGHWNPLEPVAGDISGPQTRPEPSSSLVADCNIGTSGNITNNNRNKAKQTGHNSAPAKTAAAAFQTSNADQQDPLQQLQHNNDKYINLFSACDSLPPSSSTGGRGDLIGEQATPGQRRYRPAPRLSPADEARPNQAAEEASNGGSSSNSSSSSSSNNNNEPLRGPAGQQQDRQAIILVQHHQANQLWPERVEHDVVSNDASTEELCSAAEPPSQSPPPPPPPAGPQQPPDERPIVTAASRPGVRSDDHNTGQHQHQDPQPTSDNTNNNNNNNNRLPDDLEELPAAGRTPGPHLAGTQQLQTVDEAAELELEGARPAPPSDKAAMPAKKALVPPPGHPQRIRPAATATEPQPTTPQPLPVQQGADRAAGQAIAPLVAGGPLVEAAPSSKPVIAEGGPDEPPAPSKPAPVANSRRSQEHLKQQMPSISESELENEPDRPDSAVCGQLPAPAPLPAQQLSQTTSQAAAQAQEQSHGVTVKQPTVQLQAEPSKGPHAEAPTVPQPVGAKPLPLATMQPPDSPAPALPTPTPRGITLRHHRLPNEASHFSVVVKAPPQPPGPAAERQWQPSATPAATQRLASSSLRLSGFSDADSGSEEAAGATAAAAVALARRAARQNLNAVQQRSEPAPRSGARPETEGGSPAAAAAVAAAKAFEHDHHDNQDDHHHHDDDDDDDLQPGAKTALIFPRLDEGLSSEAESADDRELEDDDERAVEADDDDDDEDDDDDDHDDDDDDDDRVDHNHDEEDERAHDADQDGDDEDQQGDNLAHAAHHRDLELQPGLLAKEAAAAEAGQQVHGGLHHEVDEDEDVDEVEEDEEDVDDDDDVDDEDDDEVDDDDDDDEDDDDDDDDEVDEDDDDEDEEDPAAAVHSIGARRRLALARRQPAGRAPHKARLGPLSSHHQQPHHPSLVADSHPGLLGEPQHLQLKSAPGGAAYAGYMGPADNLDHHQDLKAAQQPAGPFGQVNGGQAPAPGYWLNAANNAAHLGAPMAAGHHLVGGHRGSLGAGAGHQLGLANNSTKTNHGPPNSSNNSAHSNNLANHNSLSNSISQNNLGLNSNSTGVNNNNNNNNNSSSSSNNMSNNMSNNNSSSNNNTNNNNSNNNNQVSQHNNSNNNHNPSYGAARDESKHALSSDTDTETDRLLGSRRMEQMHKQHQLAISGDMSAAAGLLGGPPGPQPLVQPQQQQQQPISAPGGAIKSNSNCREVLIEGVLFNVKYLGSTHSDCEGRGEKEDRIHQAEMAVHEVKFRNGDSGQTPIEVQLFISTEKIMVLDDKHRKIMMDHSLRTISYIADIGDAIVLIVRKKSLANNSAAVGQGGQNNDLSSTATSDLVRPMSRISCHVFESTESHTITKSISQAFQVAYTELLKATGAADTSSYLPKEIDYQEVLNSQEMSTDELEMFARKENQRDVIVPKEKGEILGLSIVESGWGSVLPTVVIANLKHDGPAYRCKKLSIGDQILSVNGISLVGLPLAECQDILRKTKSQRVARLSVVPCPITVEVKIKRPDTKYQLGFSVQNGVICSLLRGGIAERGGVRVGHRIMSINGTTVVGVPHEKIVTLLASSVGEIRMKTCLTSLYRLILGEENPVHF